MDQLGYDTYWQVLNAKNYGIPQNRERVFAVSIRKDLNQKYEFPKAEVLTKKLADVLEDEVDEKFYLSEKCIQGFLKHNENHEAKGTGFLWKPRDLNSHASCLRANGALAPTDNTIIVEVKEATKKGYAEATIGDSINIEQPNSKTRRGRVGHGVAQTLTTSPQQVVVEKVVCEQRCDDELKIFKDYAIGALRDTDACGDKRVIELPCIGASRGRNPKNPSDRTIGAPTQQRLELNFHGVSNTLTTVQKDNYVVENRIVQVGNIVSTGNWDNPQRGRIYSPDGLSPALNTVGGGGLEPKIVIGSTQKNAFVGDGSICSTLTSAMGTGGGHIPMVGFENIRIRKLTPLECWRLMGFDDEDFYKAQQSGVSNSQLYKQAGNSIVVNVLEKIFGNLKLNS